MVMAVKQFEKLFREAASLDIDKSDIKRLEDFINQRLYDLLVMGQAAAKANGRDLIEVQDVPVTKGLQESIHAFRNIDEELGLTPILEHLAKFPPLHLGYSAGLEERIPEIVGGITVGLARLFKVIDPEMKNPQTEHWEKVAEIYAILG